MKTCVKCNVLKPLSEFYVSRGMRDGRRNDCKACNLAEKHERYLRNRERDIARVKKWQQENRDRLNEYRRKHRQRPEVKRRERAGHLRRKFGITLDDYDRRLAEQGGGCAVCGNPPRDDISLHVDHEHQTGRIRGLLCFRCNNALGDLGDDPDVLIRAASYVGPVAKHPALEKRLAALKAATN